MTGFSACNAAEHVPVAAARLFVQLVDLFRFYMAFPIDDHTGDPVTDEEVTAAHYEKVQQVMPTPRISCCPVTLLHALVRDCVLFSCVGIQ